MISFAVNRGGYPLKPLGDVVRFLDFRRRPISAVNRVAGPYPYYGANGIQGWVDEYIFDEPLVLLAEDGGHFEDPDRAIAYSISGKTWVNNHAHVLRPTGSVDAAYLLRVLENYDVRPLVAGTTRPKLTQAGASRIMIPVPPIEEQRRIAAVLNHADTLRCKRREALRHLDFLPQSIFRENFGGGDTILSRWPTAPMGSIISFLTSGSRGWAKYYSKEGDKFLRIQNIGHDALNLNDIVHVLAPTNAEARRTRVQAGDVLLSITADLGRVAVVPEGFGPAYINQHLSILRSSRINPMFLSSYLSSPSGQRQILARNRQGVKAGLNFDDIRSFVVPLPPSDAQKQYEIAVSRVAEVRESQSEHLAEAGAMFGSLQQRAFAGEL